jgi:class 3 adenylate cyclase
LLIDKWKKELGETPLKDFQFSRPTPPLKDLDLEELTPANSRHIDCTSVYADIDGFTKYVSERVGDAERGADAIRALHVLRKELRDVLNDFGGRKVRYIGDCIHCVLAVGERETDRAATAAQSILVAGAMRDAFKIAQEELGNIGSLGLAIGVELGPTSLTRLGVKGVRDRVGAGLAVSGAEKEQRRCTGQQTALGSAVHSAAPRGLQKLFEPDRQATSLTYNAAAIMLQASDPVMGNIVIGAAPTTKRVEYPRSHG